MRCKGRQSRQTGDAESSSLAEGIGFDLIGAELGDDLEARLQEAVSNDVVFAHARDTISIFRHAVSESIRGIESHPRGVLFQKFLRVGPYEDVGAIPPHLVDHRLSDAETAAAITFIYSFMVNAFKGTIAELLAVIPCLRVLRHLQADRSISAAARLYVGDAVLVPRARRSGLQKAADIHVLDGDQAESTITVAGVAEVKSMPHSMRRLERQMERHLAAVRRGLHVEGAAHAPGQIQLGWGLQRRIVRMGIVPSQWRLARSFRFEHAEGRRKLHVDRRGPPEAVDAIAPRDNDCWRGVLRWSQEAIAEAAYEMTFWYMEKVGEVIYSESVPKEWEEMTPAEAGRNAVKMMLYRALLRCREPRLEQRAIALYNTYGFGYALGMNHRNAEGRREVLWPSDLDHTSCSGKDML